MKINRKIEKQKQKIKTKDNNIDTGTSIAFQPCMYDSGVKHKRDVFQ